MENLFVISNKYFEANWNRLWEALIYFVMMGYLHNHYSEIRLHMIFTYNNYYSALSIKRIKVSLN